MSGALAGQEPWIGVVPVLAMGADEVLLDLLAHDAEPLAMDHRWSARPYGHVLPARHYEYLRTAEEVYRERREQARLRAIEQHRLRRIAKQEIRERETEDRRQTRADWLAMLDDAAERVRGTRHAAMLLPDLERDMKTIGGWSVDTPFPGRLDRARFEAAFAARLADCEETGS
jgi:hypothetical protein